MDMKRGASKVSSLFISLLHHRAGKRVTDSLNSTPRLPGTTPEATYYTPTVPTFKEPCIKDIAGYNPIFTASNIHDFGEVDFVADPFLMYGDSKWHLFFEVYNFDREPDAAIGHAISNDCGKSWEYTQIILETNLHLSFPYVFQSDDEFYMLPEKSYKVKQSGITYEGVKAVDLYHATDFPSKWELDSTLLETQYNVTDKVLFQWDGRYWLLVGCVGDESLYAYYSDSIHGPWKSHKANPVIRGRKRAARPAGRPIVTDKSIIMFYQDCVREYGSSVRAYRLNTLSPTEFSDAELSQSPILSGTGGIGYRSGRSHHIDPWKIGDGKWICAIDGDIGFPRGRLIGDHYAIGFGYMSNE